MAKTVRHEKILGPAGQLEVEWVEQGEDLVVLCHPHPLYGGSMHNKVISTLTRAYQELGFSTLRFNFRGVGASDGEHDYAQGELEDLRAVIAWGRAQLPHATLHLAGFSFGSYIALKAAAEYPLHSLCTVAPPVGLYDFSPEAVMSVPSSTRWILLQGGRDEVVSAAEVLAWSQGLSQSPDLHWRASASHFFHGELVWLRETVKLIRY
ncbi:MAG: alpha/beta fold hydrolase [Thiotrichales bacterium]|nr:alpha/beta fold hydrolase [Thiotrichales bacterium]